MENEISDKAANFLNELRDLCRRHGICLAVSGYDAIEVWSIDSDDDPIHANGIVDRTTPNDQAQGAGGGLIAGGSPGATG